MMPLLVDTWAGIGALSNEKDQYEAKKARYLPKFKIHIGKVLNLLSTMGFARKGSKPCINLTLLNSRLVS